jgi:hypothetical protein
MLDERTRPAALAGIATDVETVDVRAAELTAIAYGSVPIPYGTTPDALRGPHLMLISSADEPVSISPEDPFPGPPPIQQIFDSPIWREDTAADAAIDQLARDIVAITQARDALMGLEVTPIQLRSTASAHPKVPSIPSVLSARKEEQWRATSSAIVLTWVPSGMRRTADSVPIILGSVLGFLMITVFSIAAVFIKFAR